MLQSTLTEISVTPHEAALFAAATHIGFGDLLEVELPDSPLSDRLELSEYQKDVLRALRALDVRHFDCVVVHNGLPTQANIKGEHSGIKYIRKVRFETK